MLLKGLGITDASHEAVAAAVKMRSRDDWVSHFAGLDACVAPVLDMDEAPDHPHNRARGTFADIGGVMQPMPAPRFEEPSEPPRPPRREGEDGAAILAALGYSPGEIDALLKAQP